MDDADKYICQTQMNNFLHKLFQFLKAWIHKHLVQLGQKIFAKQFLTHWLLKSYAPTNKFQNKKVTYIVHVKKATWKLSSTS